jgi:hypothetical protein
MSALTIRLVRELYIREQALVMTWRETWQGWWWSQPWWPPGTWCHGRVWLWQQRLLAFARLPLSRAGLRSDPWQRQPSQHLPQLMFLAIMLLGMWLALRLHLARWEAGL